jgi:hypothetical protein
LATLADAFADDFTLDVFEASPPEFTPSAPSFSFPTAQSNWSAATAAAFDARDIEGLLHEPPKQRKPFASTVPAVSKQASPIAIPVLFTFRLPTKLNHSSPRLRPGIPPSSS